MTAMQSEHLFHKDTYHNLAPTVMSCNQDGSSAKEEITAFNLQILDALSNLSKMEKILLFMENKLFLVYYSIKEN